MLANDEKGFQGVVSMVTGFTGAMSAAQGAVGLFAVENENLQKNNVEGSVTDGNHHRASTGGRDAE